MCLHAVAPWLPVAAAGRRGPGCRWPPRAVVWASGQAGVGAAGQCVVRAVGQAVARADGPLALWNGFLPYYGRCGGHTVTMFVAVDQIRAMYLKYCK